MFSHRNESATFRSVMRLGILIRNAVLLLSASMLSPTAFASSSDIKKSNNQIGYQTISSIIDYTETGNGIQTRPVGTLDTESGAVPGVAFYISVMNNILLGNDYFKMSYDKASGRTKYIGANLNLPNGPAGPYGSVITTSGAIFTDVSLRYGKGLAMQGSSMLTPYIEIGSHSWDRGINYGEFYSHQYYGFGLLNQYSIRKKMILSVDVLYGHTSQSSIVIASGSQINGFTAALGNSPLYKVNIALDYALASKLHVNASVGYSAFIYGISAASADGLLEPDSQSNYTTLKVGLGLEF